MKTVAILGALVLTALSLPASATTLTGDPPKAGTVLATGDPPKAGTVLAIETDPSTFAFGGFAAHVRVSPARSHVALGVGAYAMDFPKVLVDSLPGNRGEDFGVRLRLGVGLFGDWFPREDLQGWFVGAQLAVQRYRYTNEAAPDATGSATNLLLMPRVGYLYQPFDAGFYLQPWVGLGLTTRVAGEARVGSHEYALFPLVPYAALHVGWRF